MLVLAGTYLGLASPLADLISFHGTAVNNQQEVNFAAKMFPLSYDLRVRIK